MILQEDGQLYAGVARVDITPENFETYSDLNGNHSFDGCITDPIAERAGLDLGVVTDAIALGQAASPQVVRNTRRMASGDHESNLAFTAALRLKDVEYALSFARGLGVQSPFGELSATLLRKLCAQGDAHTNESKIFEVLRNLPSPRR